MKIIVGFSKHKTFAIGSELIQFFMKKPFSHTYFKFKEPLYQDYTMFHAVGKGLTYISETLFLIKNTIVDEFELEVSNSIYEELMVECHKNAGLNYGYLQNLGIFLVRVAGLIGIKINKNPLNDGINCSEWVGYLLEDVYGKWTNTELNLVAPDEVYEFLKNRKNNG